MSVHTVKQARQLICCVNTNQGCIADECMAWRWFKHVFVTDFNGNVVNMLGLPSTVNSPVSNMLYASYGYCGRAGTPHDTYYVDFGSRRKFDNLIETARNQAYMMGIVEYRGTEIARPDLIPDTMRKVL